MPVPLAVLATGTGIELFTRTSTPTGTGKLMMPLQVALHGPVVPLAVPVPVITQRSLAVTVTASGTAT